MPRTYVCICTCARVYACITERKKRSSDEWRRHHRGCSTAAACTEKMYGCGGGALNASLRQREINRRGRVHQVERGILNDDWRRLGDDQHYFRIFSESIRVRHFNGEIISGAAFFLFPPLPALSLYFSLPLARGWIPRCLPFSGCIFLLHRW